MVWGGGLIAGWGALDFAGGTVVHINAGVAGLVTCIMLGKRKGYGATSITPHSVPLVVVGASMLWVGWFGFNAGSQLAADGTAGMALLVTQVATATAAFTWMVVEWIVAKKPTAVGLATGAVAGLVAITPASGTVGPVGALVIGIAAGVVCYFCSTSMKKALRYDDSLDVFGVHGIGGIVGALLTGVCASTAMGGAGFGDGVTHGAGTQVFIQFKSVIVTIIWSGVVSFIAFKIAGALTGGCRITEDEEDQGLDLNSHGESGYGS
jgi:Amt family ammonium transporter